MKTDNELIAEFMGGYPQNNAHWPGYYFFELFHGSNWWHTSDLAFDNNWTWLMPVVEKISEICKPESKEHYYWNDHEDVRIFRMPISDTYKEVIEFIKWYNSVTPKQ